MLKKVISYKDYDGNERIETFYFNISRTEAVEMEVSEAGGYELFLQKIVDEKDNKKLIEYFKKFILLAYGEKSADGKYFVKNQAISDAFSHTEAYTELFIELVNDANVAAAFVSGVLPKEPVITPKN